MFFLINLNGGDNIWSLKRNLNKLMVILLIGIVISFTVTCISATSINDTVNSFESDDELILIDGTINQNQFIIRLKRIYSIINRSCTDTCNCKTYNNTY